MINYYGYIYKTTNLLNGKVYIGKKKSRFNPKYYGSGIILKRAINKEGSNNFKLEVICYGLTKKQISELEKQYIAKYRYILGKNNVYNISDGGDGNPNGSKTYKEMCQCNFCKTKRGEPFTKEHKENMSRAQMGHPVSNRTRIKIRKTLIGQKYPKERCKNVSKALLGRHLSIEHKLHISRGMVGKNTYLHSEEHCKKVSKALSGRSLSERGHKENCKCCCCLNCR